MTPQPTHQPQPTDGRHLVLIPLAALVAILPLLVHGCSCGHDFDFHLLNWIEAANQLTHGILHPHWAYTPAFNAGEPRFVFYPPISWYLGAVLGLILTHLPGISEAAAWTAMPVLFTWIALTASGLAVYRLAREFAAPNAALLASALYIANPYMLFTAYERTAYGELLAAAWMPLSLLAILRVKVTIPGIALPLALLWLTNAPAAVMGSYTLALLAIIRLVSARRTQLALTTVAGTALGLALAAAYILPAAYERRYVQVALAITEGGRIQDNTLFHHTGTSSDALLHDEVLHTASLIAILLLIATAAALAAAFLFRKPASPPEDTNAPNQRATGIPSPLASLPVLPLAILAAAIGFLLTPWGAPIWSHAPQAEFLQFPWRLLAVLAGVFTLSAAVALDRLHLNFTATSIASLSLAAALTFPAYHVFQQPCDQEDAPAGRLALFHSNIGTDPTDEYTPVNADNDSLKKTDPPYWLAGSPAALAPQTAPPGPVPSHFAVTAAHAEDLILNLRDYPAWRILLDGAADPQRLQRDDGLIALPIPAGLSTIDIQYAHTRDQTLGDAITLLALALLIFTLRARNAR